MIKKLSPSNPSFLSDSAGPSNVSFLENRFIIMEFCYSGVLKKLDEPFNLGLEVRKFEGLGRK